MDNVKRSNPTTWVDLYIKSAQTLEAFSVAFGRMMPKALASLMHSPGDAFKGLHSLVFCGLGNTNIAHRKGFLTKAPVLDAGDYMVDTR